MNLIDYGYAYSVREVTGMQKDVTIRDWKDLAMRIRHTNKTCPRPIFRTFWRVFQVPG